MTSPNIQRTLDAVWRMESPKLIAALARRVGDVGLAEDLAQDAFVIALQQWPESGIPSNPGAWLMSTANHRAIDRLRRDQVAARKYAALARRTEVDEGTGEVFALETETHVPGTGERLRSHDVPGTFSGTLDEDLLRLMFIACHPVLSTEARVALTLRLVGGLTTDEIARAFVVPEPTVAQRIVRAKRTLAEAHVPFELPPDVERTPRLASVMAVIYLIFNEGYAATTGDTWIRPALCEDALRLGRILAELAPKEPEVHGLVALMEIQASRLWARVGPNGEPVLLLDQNRARWDQLLIGRGLAALARAEKLGGAFGPYALQAAIAACHAQAHTAAATNWVRIAALYDALAQLAPSPIVELNRAVALAMAYGPAVGLALVDQLLADPALANYHLLPSVRGDLLARLGRDDDARAEFARAAELARNERERELLLARAQAVPPGT